MTLPTPTLFYTRVGDGCVEVCIQHSTLGNFTVIPYTPNQIRVKAEQMLADARTAEYVESIKKTSKNP